MNSKIRLQPLVHIKDSTVFGYEALYTRSNGEQYPSASEILKNVFLKCGGKLDFQLFINMTLDDISSEDFCHSFLKTLDNMSIDGDKIVLEVNEGTHPDALLQAKKSLSLIRCHNVKIALDDFGTQYSGLSFMSELPVDIVKIDKKFIQDAPFSKKTRTLLKYCVDVSHDIGCDVVAEGIETTDQLECAIDANADMGQGFLFSTPSVVAQKKIEHFINLNDFRSYLFAGQNIVQQEPAPAFGF